MSELTKDNYYSLEMAQKYCSASQYKSFIGYPLSKVCEERAMAELRGEWKQETTKALLIGSILDSLWEGATTDELVDRFPECVSTKGATKGQLKSEFQQAIQLYERTKRDKKFSQYMSGEKQVQMTGVIADLPFKIRMDSFIDGVCITDLKTTQDASRDFRYYIPDSGERLPFYLAYAYDTQLAVYREVVRQNTGDTLRCYIAAIDKKPHPLPAIIEMEPQLLDEALENVKRNCGHIIKLKSGEIEPIIRCEECDYCRDTYECTVVSTSEFETHDVERNAT